MKPADARNVSFSIFDATVSAAINLLLSDKKPADTAENSVREKGNIVSRSRRLLIRSCYLFSGAQMTPSPETQGQLVGTARTWKCRVFPTIVAAWGHSWCYLLFCFYTWSGKQISTHFCFLFFFFLQEYWFCGPGWIFSFFVVPILGWKYQLWISLDYSVWHFCFRMYLVSGWC